MSLPLQTIYGYVHYGMLWECNSLIEFWVHPLRRGAIQVWEGNHRLLFTKASLVMDRKKPKLGPMSFNDGTECGNW